MKSKGDPALGSLGSLGSTAPAYLCSLISVRKCKLGKWELTYRTQQLCNRMA